jgi:DNA replication and repair protein RecF
MSFKQVRFFNFRNLKNNKVNLNASEIFLVGKNAQGKTNFLESIYLCCFGSSFRTRKDVELLKNDTEIALVDAEFYMEDVVNEISIKLFKNKTKEIKLNSNPVSDRKDLVDIIPCIIFAHKDMEYIIGTPERKRWFYNQTISIINTSFIDVLRDYTKVLKNRNILLKGKNHKLIDVYDQKLVELGIIIQKKREKAITDFNQTVNSLFKRITGLAEEIRIEYKPSWKNIESFDTVIRELAKNRERDMRFETTTIGPHRDNIVYYLGSHDYTVVASTGQIRLLALLLKLSQTIYFYKITQKKPILLLDDVLLELDNEKKIAFLESLPQYKQAFFTFLPDENYLNFCKEKTIIYQVSDGEFNEWKKQEKF